MCVPCFNDIVFVKKFCSISSILQCSYPQPMTSYWYGKKSLNFCKRLCWDFSFCCLLFFYFFFKCSGYCRCLWEGCTFSCKGFGEAEGCTLILNLPCMLHGAAQVSPPALGHLEVCFSATRPATSRVTWST